MATTPRRSGSAHVPEAPHAATVDDILAGLQVDADTGLSRDEVARRRRNYGCNELGEDDGVGWLRLLWNQLASAVVVLLLGAGVIGLIVGETIEAIAILVVLVVNTVVGIEAGEQVPADLRLIEAEGLQVEEAGLTGESDAVTKSTDPVDESAGVGDRTDMVLGLHEDWLTSIRG